MGGVKNRDAKRAAAKVFSSGGGGGSKGPSVIDKRGQEEKCPHCDRVFKQNNRLKEHIAKQHADRAQQEQPPAPVAAPQQLAASSSASRPPAPGDRKASNLSALTAAAAAAAASCSSSRPGAPSSSHNGSAKASDSPSAAAGSSSSGGAQTYDVGSRAGFYTEKSPKLMLHEWCTQQKRPKPRYKAVPVDPEKGGGFRARVVLPDPRLPGTDKDVIIWLDADHAADHEEEALQRGAVSALQAVAGDRSLDYILPLRYRPLWKDLKNKAAERAEAQRRAAAAAEERKARAAGSHNPARAPVSVVMSDKQRQAVEDLMQGLTTSSSAFDSSSSATAVAGSDDRPSEEDAVVRQGLIDSLIRSGFSAADSAAAVNTVGTAAGEAAAAAASAATAAASAGGRGYTRVWRSYDGLQPYLDWLCLNLPVERLPARYRPGGSSSTVGVLRVNNPSSSINNLPAAKTRTSSAGAGVVDSDDIPSWQQDPHVQQLVTYGYPLDHAMHALQSCGGNHLMALHSLQQQLLAGSCSVDPVEHGAFSPAGAAESDAGSSGLPQAWLDEVEVLTAIYGDDLQADAAGMLTLSRDAGDQVGGCGCLQLIVWCPVQPRQYPDAPPLIALQCSQMPAGQLLQLTANLAATARQCLGNPMIHELAVQLAEELEADTGTYSTGSVVLPAPFDQPPPISWREPTVAGAEDDANPDGYTEAAQQHTAAAEAMLEGFSDNESSSSRFSGQKRQRRHTGLSAEQAAHESKRLKEHYTRIQADANYASMKASRARLPAFSCREEVLSCVSCNDVVVISGATGCGKSTQVPQYIFEQAVADGAGGNTNIIICQPRRIAAVGLATRVADEVGDAAGVGGLVGYSVRLDTKSSQYTRLLFCTTGVLLRRLMTDPFLEGVTHVILDEVHERNLDSDLLLLLLRRTLLAALRTSSGAPPPPKVLLMSATADAQLFADYFAKADSQALLLGGEERDPTTPIMTCGKEKEQTCPSGLSVGNMSIPGFTHPVRQLWLEDVLQATGVTIGKQSRYAKQKRPQTSNFDPPDEEDSGDILSHDSDGVVENYSHTGDYNPEVIRSLQVVDPAIINYELIEALLVHILSMRSRHGPSGLLQGVIPLQGSASKAHKAVQASDVGDDNLESAAVLIFMPGAPEIDKLVRQLQASRKLLDNVGRGLRILPLHGGLPPSVQSRVFERPPKGVFKVVVATNVAETSLTIDDVVVVIDTGRHKEMSYDHTRGLSCLVETWVSQAAAQQRRGRAGRVAPGTCYRLWPSSMWKRMSPHQPPEVLRVPLQQLCLTTKAALAATEIGGSNAHVAGALSSLLTPPSSDSVQQALSQLSQLGALQHAPTEMLTPLGAHLAAMPMDAALGKALLYGCMLRCASPLLTIAAALGHGRPLWLSPPSDKRAEIVTARHALAPQAYAQRSDHLAIVATYNGWLSAKACGGKGAGSEFARTYCVSEQALEAISKGRLDLADILQQRGFLPQWYLDYLKKMQRTGNSTPDGEVYGLLAVATGAPDEYSHNARIVKAAICAGFYPRILRVEAPIKYSQVQGGAMRVDANPSTIRFFERNLGRVWMHPASVCFSAGNYPSGWVVFTQLVETSRPFIREASMVPVYALLVFGGHLEVLHDQGLLLLDGWASFKAPARVGVLIKHLRQAVSQLLTTKLHHPSVELSSQKVVGALHQLLASDGF